MRYRPEWLSDGAEVLVARLGEDPPPVYDVVVVGSGYGGAVAAARFAGARQGNNGLDVCVLERGNEYVVGSFPNRLSDLPGYVRYSRYDDPKLKGRRDGLFDLRIGADVSVLLASGLGGGSLINAAVAERAGEALRHPAWPDAIRADPEPLAEHYHRAETMLGMNRGDARAFTKYRKYAEFERFIQNYREFEKFTWGRPAAETQVQPARPARLAIWSGDPGPNDQGVHQKACIGCGDCVTGCNFSAKNTLAMNYLPDARRNGAEIYTGATVLFLEQTAGADGARWSVAFRLTGEKRPDRVANPHRVRARHVVLAAGTLGSPEILMRSRARGLKLSTQLGKQFSGNGDMISALYGQRGEVNASAPEHEPFEEREVGPTITGIAHARTLSGDRLTLEELAIPAALRRLFEEVVTTAVLPVKLGRSDWSTHEPREPDSAAVDRNAIASTQIFAAFGDDGARGRLEMVNGWESWDWDGAITVAWPNAGRERVYELQDRLLGIDWGSGGLYVRSPLWQPLPEALSAALSGPKAEGKLLTVHPLGGCPMGNDRDAGVVDDIGRVFDLKGGATTYEGLLVLDGSIIPTALGTNPLLTIAALAERAVERYAATQRWDLRLDRRFEGRENLPGPPRLEVHQPTEAKTHLRFAERMQGWLDFPEVFRRPVKSRLETEFEPIESVPGLLRGPDHAVRVHRAELSVAGVSVSVSGHVYWLELDRTTAFGRIWRAFVTWLRARGLADLFQRLREKGWRGLSGLSLWSIVKLASNVGEVRRLRYELTVEADLRVRDKLLLPKGTHVTGLKTFHYSLGGNPWRQLAEMSVTVTPPGGQARALGKLELDPLHLLRRYALQLQLERQTDAPTALIDFASIALYMARLVMKIHFWSFRLPEYEKRDPDRARRRLPGDLPGLERRTYTVQVPVTGGGSALALPLTNYRKAGVAAAELKGPVVLFHGFGSSGAQFSFPPHRPPENVVTHLANRKFDVWVPELRTSIGVSSSHNQWTLDEVANNDIPSFVDFILEQTNAPQVDVVAHCIGSAMFCTAALAGRLSRGPVAGDGHAPSKVRSAVLLQVGPLVTLSDANRFSARLITFLRRYAEVDHVDSSIDDRADWVDALLDRLLYTYPYPPEEAEHHRLSPPWGRHTHIANCNRSAGVFGRLFDHANVDKTMLDALGDIIGHTNLKTFEQTLQYAFLERLTDYNATNAYVTRENVREHFHFPVRFLHGLRNEVFSPETTTRSCRLLNEVNGAGASDRIALKDYGHLDPLIGHNVHVDVFPRISEFLLAPVPRVDHALARPRSTRFGRRPLVGPVLGWTRQEPDGQWLARIWCRADDTRVNPSFVMTMSYSDGHADFDSFEQHQLSELTPRRRAQIDARARGFQEIGQARPGDIARVYGIETLVAVDVPVAAGAAAADVEILVASAYENLTSDPSPLGLEGAASDEDRKRKYAEVIDGERAKWRPRVASGQRATQTVDAGYDERMDSVLVRKEVLEALAPQQTALSFAVASCRYAASVIDREVADGMFGRLRDLIRRAAPDSPALLLLIGDQIYADATAGVFDPKTGRERFYESYHEAWTAPNARAVLREIPTYMMMDDHEVADNWSKGQMDLATEEWGLRAFLGYQWLHSPRNAEDLLGTGEHPERERFFYTFDAAGFPFFVCDTRTTRTPGAQIIDDEQLKALQAWLERNKDDRPHRHKFIVSPSLVAPFRRETRHGQGAVGSAYLRRSDGWDGFPRSLSKLMLHIVTADIKNVVFLCGDAHQSMASRIWFEREDRRADLGTACIVSSPLYAPYPFANSRREEFAEDGALELDGGWTMRYQLQGESLEQDGFAVVRADADAAHPSLTVQFHLRDREGPEERELPGAVALPQRARGAARLPEYGFGPTPEPPPPAGEQPVQRDRDESA